MLAQNTPKSSNKEYNNNEIVGSWNGFAAEGFIMEPNGRCYCQAGESKSCTRNTRNNYKRFDFSSNLCAKEKSGQCQNMLQHQLVLHDSNIGVSNDCKEVTINLGVPIFLRDTFTAGAVYPNPEIVTVDKCARNFRGCEMPPGANW